MIFRIIMAAVLSCIVLWIFGMPKHDGFWSSVYNGMTILGTIVFYLFSKSVIWFPVVINWKIIIGFLIGCLAPTVYINHKSNE